MKTILIILGLSISLSGHAQLEKGKDNIKGKANKAYLKANKDLLKASKILEKSIRKKDEALKAHGKASKDYVKLGILWRHSKQWLKPTRNIRQQKAWNDRQKAKNAVNRTWEAYKKADKDYEKALDNYAKAKNFFTKVEIESSRFIRGMKRAEWLDLRSALIEGDTKQVKFYLKNGLDPNFKIYDKTGLKLASENGHTEIVELLKEYGATE